MTIAIIILIICTCACLVGAGITLARISTELRARGISANPLFMRWTGYRYLPEYRRVKLEETGEAGPPYNRSGNFFTLALVFGLSTILLLAL
ncbi:MAG: hypothetical protein JXA97_14285 [Anaerolineales bacterium]|nr:hypothetical protein [Anaerolineales bacterium]